MSSDFKYHITVTNVDGGLSTSRFTSALYAYTWAKRCSEESATFVIRKMIKGNLRTLSLSELKKDVPPSTKALLMKKGRA